MKTIRRRPMRAARGLFALLAAGGLTAGCASAPPAPLPDEPRWVWPEGRGAARDLDADRRTCEYQAAPWKTSHPAFHRIEVTRCLEEHGWQRARTPEPPAEGG